MNLGDVKAKTADSPKAVTPDAEIKKQLQQQGLEQAAKGVQSSRVTLSSSQSYFGLRVFSQSLNNNLQVNDLRPNFSIPKKAEKSLFDFEEVAKNVLNFVGGVIRGAKQGGMADDKLTELFEQARSGVLKGVEMAKKDLAGFMNDDISNGIIKSQELIENGIKSLEEEIFGKKPGEQGISEVYSEEAKYSRQENGDLTIKTRDGDEVTISFESLQQFQYNRDIAITRQLNEANKPQEPQKDTAKADEDKKEADNNKPVSTQVTQAESYQHFEKSGLSFSVKGELDEGELKAISDLVGDTAKLADEFFNGDVDKAFDQALKLGFDDKELTGFALNLTKVEQVQVTRAYGQVSHFNDKNEGQNTDAAKAAKPVAQYLDRLLDVTEQARDKLFDAGAFEDLVNGILNKVVGIETPELIDAINRFNGFNKRLLDNLPHNPETESSNKE